MATGYMKMQETQKTSIPLSSEYLDGHQIQKAYHPNSTTKTEDDNNIKVTSKFDKVVTSKIIITSFQGQHLSPTNLMFKKLHFILD